MKKQYKKMVGVAATAVMAVTMVSGVAQAQTVDTLKVGEAAYTQGVAQYNVPITFDKPEYTVKKGTQGFVHNLVDILGLKAQVQTSEGIRNLDYYVKYDVNSVDVNQVGDYRVMFNLDKTDDNGLARFVGKGEAVVHVVESGKPIISFKTEDMVAYVGDTFNPADYIKAVDDEDGDITDKVKVFDLKTWKPLGVLSQEGDYKLQFTVKDSDGNLAVEEKTLKVLPKKQVEDQAPVLNVPGEVTITAGSEFKVMDSVTANDKEDGDITSKVTYSGNVDVNVPGVYEITYKVADSKGHEVTAKRKVTVKAKPEVDDSAFTDVPKDSWAKKAIDQLAKDGLVKGYGDGRFGFGDNVTRGQVASLISRHLKLADVQGGTEFGDIKGDIFEQDIKNVNHAGIMVGDGSGNFRPNDGLTRYELSAVLKKAFKLEAKGMENFADVPKGHWAYDYTRILLGNNISNGMGNNEFAGNTVVKREQYAQFLYNEIVRKA